MQLSTELDAVALERRLREAIKPGTLVCEADIDEPDLVAAERVVRDLVYNHAITQAPRRCPATLASYFALRGAARYEGNGVWAALGISASHVAGDSFLRALQALRLPTFQREVANHNARRFVAPMLVHGAFPSSAALAFVERLELELQRGLVDAGEARQRMVGDPRLVGQLRRPLKRLLDWVPDYADRLIDGAIGYLEGSDPSTHLPRHLLAALEQLPSGRARYALQRPPSVAFFLDGAGPDLLVPDTGSQWNVVIDDRRVTTRPGDCLVLLPGQHVKVTLGGRQLERWSADGWWCFDLDGRLRSSDQAVPSDVVVLYPRAATLTADPADRLRIVEEGSPLGGRWSDFQSARLSLAGARSLALQTPGDGSPRRRQVQGAATVSLSGPLARAVFAEGSVVYSTIPELVVSGDDVHVRFAAENRVVTATLPASGRVPLDSVVPAGAVAGTLAVTETDGVTSRFSLVVAPGLAADVGPVLGPGDRAELTVSGAPTLLPEPVTLRPADGELCVPLHLQALPNVNFKVPVPRLRWGLRAADPRRLELADGTIHLRVQELVDVAPTLVVRCGVPARVAVEVLADGVAPHVLPSCSLIGRGQADFALSVDLAVFSDTLRRAPNGNARINLLIDGRRFEAIACGDGEPAGVVRRWSVRRAEATAPTPQPSLWTGVGGFSGRARDDAYLRKSDPIAAHLRELDESTAVVRFLRVFGAHSSKWVGAEFPDGKSGQEWKRLADVADDLWRTEGRRCRSFAGDDLKRRLQQWARTHRERIRKTPPGELDEVNLWLIGRDALDGLVDWPQWRWVAECLGGPSRSGTQRVPAVLMYHCLATAAGDEASGVVVAEAAHAMPDLVLELVAFVVQLGRRCERFATSDGYRVVAETEGAWRDEPYRGHQLTVTDGLSPSPDLAQAAEVQPEFAPLTEGSVLLRGRQVVLSAAGGIPPSVRITQGSRCLLARRAERTPDGFAINLPLDVAGEVALELISGPLSNGVGVADRLCLEVPGAPMPHSKPRRARCFDDLATLEHDSLVDEVVAALAVDAVPSPMIGRLFDDHDAGVQAVHRYACSTADVDTLDRLAIAVMPALTLVTPRAPDDATRKQIRDKSTLLEALVVPRAASLFSSALGPPQAEARLKILLRAVEQRVMVGEPPTSATTFRYADRTFRGSDVVRRAVQGLERLGATAHFIDLVVAAQRGLMQDDLTIEATRLLLDVHRSAPRLATEAALVGFYVHLIVSN